MFFFFSSRRRHTRCALVTGVQTCALPISLGLPQIMAGWAGPVVALIAIYAVHRLTQLRDKEKAVFELHKTIGESVGNTKTVIRSEERRVGKECVSTCRSRWSPYHEKKKKNTVIRVKDQVQRKQKNK